MAITSQLTRLESCRKTREIASKSCSYVLKKVLNTNNKYTETQFRDTWLGELNKSKNIVSHGGWYDPPQFGIGVLFGNETDHQRVNYPSLRPKKYWPKRSNYFQKNGIGYLFASPYSWLGNIPIIGDFGFTFYTGRNNKIIDHYKYCWYVVDKIIEQIKIGMSYRQLYMLTLDTLSKFHLSNTITSTTDKSGTDVGHCVPFIDRDPNLKELQLIKSENKKNIHKIINKARIFINAEEKYKVDDYSALTFEPRLISSIDRFLPMFSFHTIIQFVSGKKIVISNMDEILKLLNMQWIYE